MSRGGESDYEIGWYVCEGGSVGTDVEREFLWFVFRFRVVDVGVVV